MKTKKYVEINGKMWEADLPFCCGCSEFVAFCGCGYEGNGCRFSENRIKRPISFKFAYLKMCEQLGKDWTEYSDELGSCVPEWYGGWCEK